MWPRGHLWYIAAMKNTGSGILRALKRTAFVLLLLVLIAGILYCVFFWRAVQMTGAIGLDGAWQTSLYVMNVIRDFGYCHGEDQFRTKIAGLERATEGEKGDTSKRRLLARLYCYTGDFRRSEAMYREMLALSPDDPDLLKGLGLLLMRRGEGLNCAADRKSTRLNSSHIQKSRMPSSA